jgi:hypothetical protein
MRAAYDMSASCVAEPITGSHTSTSLKSSSATEKKSSVVRHVAHSAVWRVMMLRRGSGVASGSKAKIASSLSGM